MALLSPSYTWFPSGKCRQGTDWNFPGAPHNRSPSFAGIDYSAVFMRFPVIHPLALKPYERFRESPNPSLCSISVGFPDGICLAHDHALPTGWYLTASARSLGDNKGTCITAVPQID